jgi:hypothetical protein
LRRPLVTLYLVIISAFLIISAPFFVIIAWETITNPASILDHIFLVVMIFCFPIVLMLAYSLLKPQLRELMRRGGI